MTANHKINVIGNNPFKGSIGKKILLILVLALLHSFILYVLEREPTNWVALTGLFFRGVLISAVLILIFPLVIKMMFSLAGRNKGQLHLETDEQIRAEGPLKLQSTGTGLPGKLSLTNQRMVFQSYRKDAWESQFSVNYQDIQTLTLTPTFLFGKLICVETSKQRYQFLSFEADTWLKELTKAAKLTEVLT